MMVLHTRLRNLEREKALSKLVCLSLMWIVSKKSKARILKGEERSLEVLLNVVHFLVSLLVGCNFEFKWFGLYLNYNRGFVFW